MSVKTYLRSTYGNNTAKLSAAYGKCLEKIARHRNHVVYSLRCKEEGYIPKSLRMKSPVDTVEGQAIAQRPSRQFLNERLRLANHRLRQLEEEKKWREIGLQRALSATDAERVKKMATDNAEHVFIQTREKQREKLARCIQKDESNERKEGEQEKKKKWVVNLSTHQLTSGEKSILEKGFNFALGPRKVPNIEVIAAIEPTLRDEEDQVRAERARAAIAGILRNAKPPRPNITREERQALTDLRKNDDIKINRTSGQRERHSGHERVRLREEGRRHSGSGTVCRATE